MQRFGLGIAALTLTLTVLEPAQAAPLPDLVISNVVVSGSTARVLVRNQGDGPAAACTLGFP